jgi:tetratricopeptide (TPR) repeat protein
MYVTGNVTGGASFQGVVPYNSVGTLGNVSGLSTLDTFRRDSVGVNQLSSGLQQPQYYVGSERAVTTMRDGRVWQTNQPYQPPTSWGASTQRGFGGQSNLAYRPLDSGFSLNTRRYQSGGLTEQPDLTGWTPSAGNSFDASQGLRSEQWRLHNQNIMNQQSQQAQQNIQRESIPQSKPANANNEAEGAGKRVLQPIVPLEVPEIAEPGAIDEEQQAGSGSASPSGFARPSPGTAALNGAKTNAASSEAGDRQIDFARRKVDGYFSEGRQFMHEGKFYQAITALDMALIYGPNDAKLYQAKSYALVAAGELMSAAFYLDRAITLSPETVITPGDIKEFFPDAGQLQKHIETIDYWAKQSGNAMLSFLKGYMLYQAGQAEAAGKVLTEAFEGRQQSQAVKLLIEGINKTEK